MISDLSRSFFSPSFIVFSYIWIGDKPINTTDQRPAHGIAIVIRYMIPIDDYIFSISLHVTAFILNHIIHMYFLMAKFAEIARFQHSGFYKLLFGVIICTV